MVKFDLIVGNPPYQRMDGGASVGSSASPLYHNFIERSIQLTNRLIAMIVPARWYSGGKGLTAFRRMMFSCGRISTLVDFQNSLDCFANVAIEGGVMWFVYDTQHQGNTRVINRRGEDHSELVRPLIEKDFSGVFLRDNHTADLYKKIMRRCREANCDFMSSMVSPTNPYGIRSNFSNYKLDHPTKYDVAFYIRVSYKRIVAYTQFDNIRSLDGLEKWKVFVSKANGGVGNKPTMVISPSFIGQPGYLCSETYRVLGSFDTAAEAKSLESYSKTKFFRFMLLANKNDKNIPRSAYSCVPVMPWDRTYTDELLYDAFGLTADEADIIDFTIKPIKS